LTEINDYLINDAQSQLLKLNCKYDECYLLISQNGLVIPISLACKAPENLTASLEYTLLVSVADQRVGSLPLPPQKVTTIQNKISTSAVLSVAPPTAPIEEKQLIAGTELMLYCAVTQSCVMPHLNT
jgi:hypothetical protein